MLWNGNECGKRLRWQNLKATIPEQTILEQKQLKNVKYFKYLSNMRTKDVRCTREMKSGIAMAKATFKKKKKYSLAN